LAATPLAPSTPGSQTAYPQTEEQIGDQTVAFNDESFWLSGYGQITRVHVASNQIDTMFQVHARPNQVGLGFDSVWVAYPDNRLVQRLDITP
jgi:hypothetical protein